MLIAIPSVFSKTEVEKINQHLSQGEWVDGHTTAGEQARSVKQNQQLADESQLSIKLGDIVLDALARHPLFLSAALPLKIFPPMFNRYQGGETYGIHVDNAVRFVPGSATRVRSDLSATLFLSEPEEYEGGELEIQEQFGTQNIKLAAGDMILYPSSSLHQVKAVTSGSRVCAVLWMQSMVRDNQQRAMLFDLDQSIQSLTAENGHQDDNVMKLTGIYQNLIRQWADT
jgi:PKHD-type hydroxylase